MKIKNLITNTLTMDEFKEACKITKLLREDRNLSRYLNSAAEVASRCNHDFLIYEPLAQIAKNCRVSNYYGDNSRDLDVWISCIAYGGPLGIWEVGAYLSDIWQLSADNAEDTREKMYIVEYQPTTDPLTGE